MACAALQIGQQRAMKVSLPVTVSVPELGAVFAESVHATGFRMDERNDPFHKIIYVLRGRVSRQDRQGKTIQQTEADAGSILVVPSGIVHRFQDVETSTLLLLCVAEGFLRASTGLTEAWKELSLNPLLRLDLDRIARQKFEGLWRRALLEQSYPRLGSGPAVSALAIQILVQLARRPRLSIANASSQRVAAVVRELDETFFEPWSLDRASARAGLSRRRFSDLFRDLTDVTLYQYLLHLRLTRAEALLRSGDYSILGVMFTCGFNDVSHFYRVFKQRFGNAPKAWMEEQTKRSQKP